MRRLLVTLAVGAIAIGPVSAGAAHHGCTVTPNAPKCTYTAVGGEIARGGASSTLESAWEAWVTRDIDGVPTKVRLAGESSLLDASPEGHPVPANPGELVTVELLGGMDGTPGGVVNVGLESQHP